MSKITWLTTPGTLFTATENEYVEYQLDAYDSAGGYLRYKIVAGSLGYGIQLFNTGLLQGIPVVENATDSEEYVKTFTVRAYNTNGNIADRTFSFVVTSPALPEIYPKNTSLGSYYDGYKLSHQLTATDASPDAALTWALVDGELPEGITLSTDGTLTGYIYPVTDEIEEANLGWDNSKWDSISWDAETTKSISKTYYFTVRVYDKTRYDESRYSITVLAKSAFSADSTEIYSDNDVVTVDIDVKHTPFISTDPSEIPVVRQDSNFAFRIVGIDFNGDELAYVLHRTGSAFYDQGGFYEGETYENIGYDEANFDQPATDLPAGLELDSSTGWITGTIDAQTEVSKEYVFTVSCHKAAAEFHEGGVLSGAPLYQSEKVTFTLVVLGDLHNTITWVSPSYLGEMDNGSISEFSVEAVSSRGKILTYSIKSGSYSRLPQGIKFTSDGLLVGRASFEVFEMDNRTTTFDGGGTTFDQTYKFTVVAAAIDGSVSDEKTFTLTVNDYNEKPYENLYLKALTTRSHRQAFKEIINDTTLFPSELIFRENDPYFGKASDIKFLFAAGIGPSEIAHYIEHMPNNHYTKRIELKNVKTAQALDESFNVKYEVVYVDLNDSGVTALGSAPNTIDITDKLSTQYQVDPYKTLYPNSLVNMKSEISTVGYANRGAIPQWMVNQQKDGTVLGFTNAVILAYTIAGASDLIAYRLKNDSKYSSLGAIDFTLDRYHLDNYLSKNYTISDDVFIESKETTFDMLPTTSDIYPYAGAVDVAVSIPFDEINGRTVDYIKLRGGLDGVMTIKTGMTLVFAKQENFGVNQETLVMDTFAQSNYDARGYDLSTIESSVDDILNDGWNNNLSLYADDVDVDGDGADDNNSGYGMGRYAESSVIPGYLESIVQGVVNQRGGIWQITVDENNIVSLTMIQEVVLNQYVQVAAGNTYRATQIYYDPIVKVNNSVPEYSRLVSSNVDTTQTVFDGGSTRFYDNRDQYADPGTDDKYLKFPKNNCFV